MILSILSYIKKNLKEQIPEEILNPIVRRNTIQKVDARNEYYVVQGCIEKFYLYYSNIFKNPLDDYKFDPPPEELNKDPEQTKKEAIEKV